MDMESCLNGYKSLALASCCKSCNQSYICSLCCCLCRKRTVDSSIKAKNNLKHNNNDNDVSSNRKRIKTGPSLS